ncbi:MAG: DNA polymerase III subunit gamma/tau [Microbacterium sp.]
MAGGRDDDALAWGGDDDPTLDLGSLPADAEPDAVTEPVVEDAEIPETPDAAPAALPKGYTAVGKGSDEVGRVNADGSVTMPGERVPMGNATLIGLGILGGVYLIYAIGWVIGGLRLQDTPGTTYLVTDVMYQGSLWLAVLAPLMWFGTVFLLTLHSKSWVRFAWLIAGVALLLPWPFIMIGAVGR